MKHIHLKKIMPLFLCLAACTHSQVETAQTTSYRSPASVASLIEGSEKILKDIKNPQKFNQQNCENYIGSVTEYLYYLPSDYFIPKSYSELALLKKEGPKIIDTIFTIRTELKKRLSQMTLQKRMDTDCVNSIREAFQYARFAEEYVLEWLYAMDIYKAYNGPVLTGGKPYTWSHSSKVELKSGDVLLIRGKSHVSAMIARIADQEGNFSHIAMVGEDPQGRKYIIESLIETGVIITPLEKWQKEQLARVALYRFYNAEIAAKAGKYAYQLGVQSSQKNIRYDFTMNEKDYSTMFCSEIVRYAYDVASGGGLKLPYYMSSLNKFKGRAFPANMGVVQNQIFAPFDIDVDPQFELVAEYRYRPYLRKVRVDDAVLQSIYGWITDRNYQFQSTLGHSAKALLGKTIRQFGLMSDTLPTYMPVKTINIVLQFETTFAALFDNLGRKETEYYRQHNHMMTFQQMMQVNEEFRRQDCANNLADPRDTGATSKFHWFFSPLKRQNCAL